jgi:hypothetical protein
MQQADVLLPTGNPEQGDSIIHALDYGLKLLAMQAMTLARAENLAAKAVFEPVAGWANNGREWE